MKRGGALFVLQKLPGAPWNLFQHETNDRSILRTVIEDEQPEVLIWHSLIPPVPKAGRLSSNTQSRSPSWPGTFRGPLVLRGIQPRRVGSTGVHPTGWLRLKGQLRERQRARATFATPQGL